MRAEEGDRPSTQAARESTFQSTLADLLALFTFKAENARRDLSVGCLQCYFNKILATKIIEQQVIENSVSIKFKAYYFAFLLFLCYRKYTLCCEYRGIIYRISL